MLEDDTMTEAALAHQDDTQRIVAPQKEFLVDCWAKNKAVMSFTGGAFARRRDPSSQQFSPNGAQ